MSAIKEPSFFSGAAPEAVILPRTKSDYLRLFEGGSQARGESSTSYTMWPFFPKTPELIAAEVPDAKLVYLVRNPVDRVRSKVVQMLSNPGPLDTLPAETHLDELFDEAGDHWEWITCGGLYMTQIRRYLDHFPASSLLVVDSSDLLESRTETMARVFSHIGVDPEFRSAEFDSELNAANSKLRTSNGYLRLARNQAARSALMMLPFKQRRKLVDWARNRFNTPLREVPALDDAVKARLGDLYRPEVEELRAFTGQRFAGWSI